MACFPSRPDVMKAFRSDLVWFAGVQWDGIRGTDRHMVTAISQHFNVLWVDPPVSPLTSLRSSDATHAVFRPRLSVASERVTRLTPVALPGVTRWGVRATTSPLVRAQVRWALHRTGSRPRAVVATRLDDVLGRWGKGVSNVLYGTDDYVAGGDLMGLSPHWLEAQEREALTRADVVIAVSDQLADRWRRPGVTPVVIPNGCNDAGDNDAVPAVPLRLPRPVVGLVGQLSDRIDLDIVEGVVDAGLSLLLVGPKDPRWEPERFDSLVLRPGVHFAGPVPADEVPSYLAAIDVGITPYRDSPFNQASFPLKTLEYLGAGRAVVSTALPSARWLKADLAKRDLESHEDEILVLADDVPGFVDALRRVANGGCGLVQPPRVKDEGRAALTKSDRCRAFAAEHSWSRRADAFTSAIGLATR